MSEGRWHYFVGDIHGCYEAYQKLEEKILRHAMRNGVEAQIVSVGDLVDRGPQSAQVVRHFRRGAEAGTHVAVIGNHEAFFISTLWHFMPWGPEVGGYPEWLFTLPERHEEGLGYARVLTLDDYCHLYRCMWLGQGGFETLESFGCHPHDTGSWQLEEEDLSFLAGMPVYWQSEEFLVTHALASSLELERVRGFEPRREGEPQLAWEERSHRYKNAAYQLMWRREPPKRPADPQRLHISGHTPMARVKRRSALKTLQIDTGCVYGERLTAWCGEANHYLRVGA